MSESDQLSNYQQQYMQQYQQYQQYYQNYSQQYWGRNATENNEMDGPSFTGEASVFRTRDMRYKDQYGDRQTSSGDAAYRRSRSRSRDRDDMSDSRAQRLQETLKKLQQLEDQQLMQERVIKDMKMELQDSTRKESGSRRSSDTKSASQDYRDYAGLYYGSSGYGYGSGYGSAAGYSSLSGLGGETKRSSYDDAKYSSRASTSSSSLDGPNCYKCNKRGHISRNCTARDTVCYICDKEGHVSKNCPQGSSRSSSSGPMCFKCNEKGHFALNCPAKEKVCYECKKQGHVSKDCPKLSSRSKSGGPMCFKCNEKGHLAIHCPATDIVCYTCKKQGHVSHDCPTKPSYDTRTCFICHKPGHLIKNCPSAPALKCLRCGGMGHVIKNCTSKYGPPYRKSDMQCYRCTGFGHKGNECASTETWKGTPTSSSSSSSPKPSTSSKFKYYRLDAETVLLSEAVTEFAQTNYPVPNGSKTREEIDEVLKGMEERSRILEKELPPAANTTETTISNQCQILGKMKWKDAIYDRLVESLYCYICQRSFTQEKYYLEHVSNKEHRNAVSNVVNASQGGSVRAKLLKKICGLPSIYQQKLPAVPGEEEENADVGLEIKPDLLNSTSETKKYFVCRVCHSWGETPLKDHFESEKHKYLFENQWWCKDCNAYFRAYSDLKDHKLGVVHKEVTSKLTKEGTTSKKRSHDSGSDERPSSAKKSRYSTEAAIKDEDGTLGMEFLLPVTGFYCKLCNKFYNEAKVSKMDHCTAQIHQDKLQVWNGENGQAPPAPPASKNKENNDTSGVEVKGEVSPQDGQTEKQDGDVNMEAKPEDQEDVSAQIEGQNLMVIDDINDESVNVLDESQDPNEPLEAEVASEDDEEEEDEETSRATRRRRSAVKSPKTTRKSARKV